MRFVSNYIAKHFLIPFFLQARTASLWQMAKVHGPLLKLCLTLHLPLILAQIHLSLGYTQNCTFPSFPLFLPIFFTLWHSFYHSYPPSTPALPWTILKSFCLLLSVLTACLWGFHIDKKHLQGSPDHILGNTGSF